MKSRVLSNEEMRILRLTKKKRRITCRDVNYWILVDMMRKTILDKIIPKKGNAAGWPYFKVSARGNRILKRSQEKAHGHQR